MESIYERIRKTIGVTSIYRDGIISPPDYANSPPGLRLLFMAKEPNASNHDAVHNGSFIDEWSNTLPTYRFARRIAEWTYGITNDFPNFQEAKANAIRDGYLRRIAFINYKKTGGVGTSIPSEFVPLYNNDCYNEIIRSQIDHIKPDIVILGVSFITGIINGVFPELVDQWCDSECNGLKVGRYNETRVINFYHPSARSSSETKYDLLRDIINGSVYKNL